MGKTVTLWGKGYGVERVIQMCREANVDVLAILDNNPAKWGTRVLGVETLPPDRLPGLAPDHVLVLSRAFEAIADQAASLGFPRERVLDHHANPQEALHALGGSYCVCHFRYAWDGACLCTSGQTFPVRGRVVDDVPSPVPVDEQRRVVAGLLDAYLLAERDARQAPPVYQAGENWAGVLRDTWGEFYHMAQARDVEGVTAMLGNFCRNRLSRHILGGEEGFRAFAGHPRQEPWLQHNLEVWMALADGQASLDEAVMPPIGNPYGYDCDGRIINWNSFVNHGRALRLTNLLEGIPRPVVAEIGGGFGCFAYHLARRAAPVAYIDFDLPENLLIASYYLRMAFPEKRFLHYQGPDTPLDATALADHDILLLPNFMLPRLPDLSADLFVNTISFSEMEYETIAEYFRQIDRCGRRYLYHENLACHPEYKGYPSAVFPRLQRFRQLFASISPWHGLDAYALGHCYMERLFERRP